MKNTFRMVPMPEARGVLVCALCAWCKAAACWRAEACSDGAQRNRAWAGVKGADRGGRRAILLHCAAMYSGKLSPRGGVLLACGVLWGSQLATGHLRCQRMRVLLWSVFECGSLGTL